ncbi:hypothetical protein K432DRAFT_360417 [Lepidopterella palustris CBS 459.81]|uniref:Uncharacterized protein n=1 Tax=Lepidopterella palustris CBS 459.81 TaxID=1314670 RepID=A0A8E2E2X7_9PEZI|nr:hypothetical protein K432DRAFT_360417 [Lepidopterella palustris CBS 459.81]
MLSHLLSTSPARLIITFLSLYQLCAATTTNEQQNSANFTIIGGQIYTPGLAIIDSPQPFTPEGGDFLQVALDISGDGRLPQPPNNADPLTQIFNITLFLTSVTLSKNFTISNGTGTLPPLAPILAQEPGSTVKHVNFEWPDCLSGSGGSDQNGANSSRGAYNISIHQNYRWNGTNFYTIFNLPISVSNGIVAFPPSTQILVKPIPGPVDANGGRVACALLENPMLSETQLAASVNNPATQPYIGGTVSISGTNSNGGVGGGGTVGGQGQAGGGGTIGNSNGLGQGEIGDKPNTGDMRGAPLGALVIAIGVAVCIGWSANW